MKAWVYYQKLKIFLKTDTYVLLFIMSYGAQVRLVIKIRLKIFRDESFFILGPKENTFLGGFGLNKLLFTFNVTASEEIMISYSFLYKFLNDRIDCPDS